MDPYHTPTPSDVAFWSCVSPQEGEQTTAWFETAGYVQQAPDFDAILAGSVANIDWDWAAAFANPPSGETALPNLEATRAVAFNPGVTFPDHQAEELGRMDPDFLVPWLMPTPPLTDVDSGASLGSGSPQAGLSPSPAEPVAAPQIPSQFTSTSFVCPTVDGSVSGQIVPGYGADPFGFAGVVSWSLTIDGPITESSFPAGCGEAGLCVPTPSAVATSIPHMLTLPQVVLGKRCREADDILENGGPETMNNQDPRMRKKGKAKTATTTGVMEARGSTNRTRHKPVARTPDQEFDDKSMAVGRGAERLATPNARGVYHRFLQGPSVQQESVGTPAQEQLLWVEGSVQGATWHHIDSVVPPEEKENDNTEDGKLEEPESQFFRISRRLNKRHRALLEATSADWARGAIRVLKCRLCPSAGFSKWVDFKRHCDSMEAHPLKISFCDYCGDFFARRDALDRHRKNRPPQCLSVSLDKAEAKRRETEKVHKEFQARLECCLETGGEIGMPFSQTIMTMYPNSSKRGSRQQSRLQEPERRV